MGSRENKKCPLIVATDGSVRGTNPSDQGGWAWVSDLGSYCSGTVTGDRITNNQMEFTAVLEALKAFPAEIWPSLVICSDSQYVVNSLTKWIYGWKKRGWVTASYKGKPSRPVENRALIEGCFALLRPGVKLEWIRGHDGHPLNERVDRLAVEAARGHPVIGTFQ